MSEKIKKNTKNFKKNNVKVVRSNTYSVKVIVPNLNFGGKHFKKGDEIEVNSMEWLSSFVKKL